jgi:hypothetical protein
MLSHESPVFFPLVLFDQKKAIENSLDRPSQIFRQNFRRNQPLDFVLDFAGFAVTPRGC